MFDFLFQNYSRKFVQQTLSRLQNGRLTIVSKDEDGEEKALVYGPESARVSASITIVNSNAWRRICQAFDLVYLILCYISS